MQHCYTFCKWVSTTQPSTRHKTDWEFILACSPLRKIRGPTNGGIKSFQRTRQYFPRQACLFFIYMSHSKHGRWGEVVFYFRTKATAGRRELNVIFFSFTFFCTITSDSFLLERKVLQTIEHESLFLLTYSDFQLPVRPRVPTPLPGVRHLIES